MDSSKDNTFLPTILELLITLIDNNLENQLVMVNMSGFSIISVLLEKISPDQFDQNVLMKLFEIYNIICFNDLLLTNFIDTIFCNFKLWVFCSFSIQLFLFNHMKNIISSNISLLTNSDIYNFQKWIDSLYLFYDYNLPNIELKQSNRDDYTAEDQIIVDDSRDHQAVNKPSRKGIIFIGNKYIRSGSSEISGENLFLF